MFQKKRRNVGRFNLQMPFTSFTLKCNRMHHVLQFHLLVTADTQEL